MNRRTLERADEAITELREKNKEFYGELMLLFHKYINYYFVIKRFSLSYRSLFRIITDRVREEDLYQKQYNSMKNDVAIIRRKYGDIFDNFSAIVKRHVDMYGIGYNMLLRLMYGESIECILKETSTEETDRQELRFSVINRLLDILKDKENELFKEGITKNIVIANFISNSKTYDSDLLRQLNFAFYQLKDGDLSITFASEKDIKDTIIESVDISSGDIGEAPAYLTGGRPVAEEILNHPDYKDEVIHLEETINEMLQEIDTLENESNEIYTKQKQLLKVSDKRSIMGDLNTYSNIQKGIYRKIKEIESALDSPYFGRVDFREDNSNEFESLYIGKNGFKQGSKYGVIDWRVPIASVFYECENGRATYKAPGGIFSGDVKLKRQYTIIDSQLISFTDDIIADKIAKSVKKVSSKEPEPIKDDVISDPFLLKRLKRSTDKRLKEIIETIRAEQNRIIRQPLNKVLVVQGVAGSGKSTVGLHRISYILYNNKGIDPGKILVVAPNKVFLDYISELLPGIDAEGVVQLTFEQLVSKILETDLKMLNDEKMEFFVNMDKKNLNQFLKDALVSVSKFKGSLSFIKLFDYIIMKKNNEIINSLENVSLFGEKLKISRQEQARYLEGNAPINNKILTLRKAIESRVKAFIEHQAFFTENIDTLKQEAASFLHGYLKKLKRIEPMSIYKELYEDDYVYKVLYKNRYFSFVAQYTLKYLESGYVEREDLAALCYIKSITDGISHEKKYLHIFVDEAQDLSPLEFVILKLVSQNNSMTIMGDMNQGINSHRGINNWGELINDIYKELNPQYFEICNSYRSTREIVEFSNKLIPKGLPEAKPVARDGEKPGIEKISSDIEGINRVIDLIKHYRSKGCSSIGILAKREGECRTIYSELKKTEDGFENLNLNLIDDTTENYNGGISVVPIVLSKGLEFDAVILWNASDEKFNDTGFDSKILYVAVTRPMHYLHILYKGNITSHLKGFVYENTGRSLIQS